MDVAKYIGLFLLKNNYCYIHGLGNLELKKKSASYDGQALTAPSYQVMLTPSGSIDDNLANFIATNEQISISKAANELRDFSTQTKADLQAGKEVAVPSLGKFVEQNGRIQFVSDPHLQYTPPSIPTIKTATRSTVTPKPVSNVTNTSNSSYSYHPEDENGKGGAINWSKIILMLVLAAVVITAIIFGMNYMQPKAAEPAEPEPLTVDTAHSSQAAPVMDSVMVADTLATAAPSTANAAATTVTGDMLNLDIILKTYPDSSKAGKRTRQLVSYGHNVSMMRAADGTSYHVVMSVNIPATDTTHVLDSLRRTFNPAGVSVLR